MLIYCIRLLCDWSFRLCHYIIYIYYFVASCQFFLIKLGLMVLFCTAIRRDSVFLLRFLFHGHVQVFSCEISLVCRFKCSYNCFSSHFYFLVIFVPLKLVLFILFLVVVISLPSWNFMQSYSRCIDVSTLSWMLVSPFPLLFLTHTVCLRHLWDVRPYVSSWVFLFSSPFVEVLFGMSLRMAPSILQGRQPR